MTYKTEKFYSLSKESNPSIQDISTTYTEITGSKCNVIKKTPNSNIYYKFCFYMGPKNLVIPFIHVKLQKSNDNFSSNIVDISGCQLNLSGDTLQSTNYFYKAYTAFFIIENFDSNYLRLVTRSFSTNSETFLHQSYGWDGLYYPSINPVYCDPVLTVAEI